MKNKNIISIKNSIINQYKFNSIRRNIRPLTRVQTGFRKSSGKIEEVVRLLLQEKREKYELEVCDAVDRCLDVIRSHSRKFFSTCEKNAIMKLQGKVNKKSFFNPNIIVENIVPSNELEELQAGIKHEIQAELKNLFGIASINIAACKYQLQQEDLTIVNEAMVDYCDTLTILNVMTEVADKLWSKSLKTLHLPGLVEKIAGEYKLGTIYMELVDCRPDDHRRRASLELERRIRGVLRNAELRLVNLLSSNTVDVFYQLFDKLIADQLTNRAAELLQPSRQRDITCFQEAM